MSDFERDILRFVPVLHEEAARDELLRREAKQHNRQKAEAEAARLERARITGKQAVEILLRRGIEPLPVMKRPTHGALYGSPAPTRVYAGDGWHLFYKLHYDHYRNENLPDHYALYTDGSLQTFAYGDKNMNIRAINDPRPMHPQFECETLENDGFKKAVAGIIAGFGVLEFDHI